MASQRLKKILQKVAQLGLFTRLLLFFTLFSLLAWGTVAVVAWKSDAKHVRIFLDTQMVLFAKTLSELDLSHLHGEIDDIDEVIPERREKSRFLVKGDFFGFAVFSSTGGRILSDDDDGKDFPFIRTKGFHKVRVDDDWWRIFVYISENGERYISVGQKSEYRHNMAFKAFFRHLIPWLILLPLFLVGLGWLLYKELRPLRTLAQSLQRREATSTALLDESHLTPETRQVVQSLNRLFERISSLLERERAFVSNAAHELRTPLAGLRVQAEVLEMCMDDPKSQKNALQKILQGSLRCSHLVEQLLLLSSLEAKNPHNENTKENIQWAQLLLSAVEDIRLSAHAKNVHLDCKLDEASFENMGFVELWNIALRNILDNAVRYTPENGSITVRLQHYGFYIENSAPHIPENVLTQLGQRFYRPPGQEMKGSGLGLAIVRHVATLHGAHMCIENIAMGTGEGVRVSIQFS